MSKSILISSSALDQIEMRLSNIEATLALMKENHFNENGPIWLNTKEAAKALGVSIRSMQSYRDQSVIPFSQFGREIRYRADDIQEFLMRHYNEPRFWKKEGGQQDDAA